MKRINSFINLAIGSLLVLIGFGGCYSSKKATKAQEQEELMRKAEQAALQEARTQDSLKQVREQEMMRRQREKTDQRKVVYGPAPSPYKDSFIDLEE